MVTYRPFTDPLSDTWLETTRRQKMDEAMRRFAVLKPHIDDGVALTKAARASLDHLSDPIRVHPFV
jgi:hypothetical protein